MTQSLSPGVRERRWPGLVVALAGVVGAQVAATALAGLSPLTAAVAIGAVLANTGRLPASTQPGLAFASRHLLRAGIVLLGFRLALGEVAALGGSTLLVVALAVAVTFAGTRWLGGRLGLSPGLTLLVATGFSICGASAIAAMQGVARAEDEEVAFSIGLVTLCGSLAIVLLPVLQVPLGLVDAAFGQWVGASVHDVGQVVATAGAAGTTALSAAVVVKLTRVLLLGPLVVGMGLAARRTGRVTEVAGGERPPLIPLFVVGFLAAVAARSTGWIPAAVLESIGVLESLVLSAALVGLGAGVEVAQLRRLGTRPLLLGGLAWALIAGVAYLGLTWFV